MKNSCPHMDSNPLSLAYKTGALTDWAIGNLTVDILKVNDKHIPYYVFKQVQSKTRNTINCKFHFIIYRDLNVTVFSYNKYIDEVQHGAVFMLLRIALCSWWEMNLQWSIAKKSDLVLLFTLQYMIKLSIYLFLPPRVTSNLYRF